MTSGAEFSPSRKHRYVLWRIWDELLPKLMLIGLNPSTANEDKSDNTITKVIKVAKHNGFGGIYMLNLFHLVSPNPEDLLGVTHHELNNERLLHYASLSGKVCFCWGNFKIARERAEQVKQMFTENVVCFKQNKNGSPKHPLYCLDDTVLIPYRNMNEKKKVSLFEYALTEIADPQAAQRLEPFTKEEEFQMRVQHLTDKTNRLLAFQKWHAPIAKK